MAQIHNSDLSKELIKGGRLQVSRDVVPNQLAEKVVPVMEVNPKLLKIANIVRSATAVNSTSSNIYTTPTDRDFYLTFANISVLKDVTSTSTETSIKVTIDGILQRLISIAGISLTPQTLGTSQSFDIPIKIDRGTGILVTNGTNVANINAWGNIAGYIDDVSNA
jgi:hypothetical protein